MNDDTLIVPADPDSLHRESAGTLKISAEQIAGLKIQWGSWPKVEEGNCPECGLPYSLNMSHRFLVATPEGDYKFCPVLLVRKLSEMLPGVFRLEEP